MPPSSSPPRPAFAASSGRDPTTFGPRHWVALAGITALGAALRFVGVGEWALWVDEAHTWRDATMPLAGEGGFLGTDRVLYSLTFFLLRGLMALGWIGQDEGSLRLPFVLVGILTVPLMGVCGRKLVGAWAAVFAALLLAVHPWHVFWSQNARGYVFVVLAAVLTADRVFAYVQRQRLRDLLAIWAAIGFGTLSHSTGALLAVGFVAFLVLRASRVGRRDVVKLAVLGVALAVVLPWMVEHWAPFEGFLRSKGDRPSLVHFVQTTGYYFRPVVLAMAAVGLWLLRHVGGRDRALVLGCLSAVPLVVLLAVGAQVVLTTARYGICALPIVVWLAAFAAVQFAGAVARGGRNLAWRRWLLAAVLPLLAAGELGVQLVDYYTVQHGQRARWSEAAAFLRAEAGGRPLRVGTVNHPSLLYYLRPGHYTLQVPAASARNRVVPLLHWMVHEGQDEFRRPAHAPGATNHLAWHRAAARADGALLAFVVTLPELIEQDPDGSIRAAIAAECRLALHLPCWVGPKDESIYVYLLEDP